MIPSDWLLVESTITDYSSTVPYYRKRGSASYIVREVRSVRERERERYRERERDSETEVTSR